MIEYDNGKYTLKFEITRETIQDLKCLMGFDPFQEALKVIIREMAEDLKIIFNNENNLVLKKPTKYLTNFEKVKQFHEIFSLLINEKPTLPPPETKSLRKELIREEYDEVQEALDSDDIYEIAKELADLIYVLYGCGVTYGIDMDKVFEEVHASNLSKLTKDGKVLRREDGKVLKSDQFFKADMRKVLDGDN